MNNKIITAVFILLFSPMLSNCVQTQDVTNLDLRIRNLDNRIVKLNKTVSGYGDGTKGSPIEKLQSKQAEVASTVDRLNMELLQVKGQLDESGHHFRNTQQDNDKSKSSLNSKIDDLSDQIILLADQLNQVTERLNELQKTNQDTMAQAKAAEERAQAAEQAAARAAEQAKKKAEEAAARKKKAAKPKGPREIAPDQAKQKPGKMKKAAKASKKAAQGSTGPGKGTYDKGLSLFRAGKFNDAYRTFTLYIDKNPKGAMVPNARFWLGDCYYNQQEFELAILEYQKVIANFPSHAKSPASLLKQGLAFEKLKDNDTAKIVYKKLLDDYSKSEQAQTAKKRLESLK